MNTQDIIEQAFGAVETRNTQAMVAKASAIIEGIGREQQTITEAEARLTKLRKELSEVNAPEIDRDSVIG